MSISPTSVRRMKGLCSKCQFVFLLVVVTWPRSTDLMPNVLVQENFKISPFPDVITIIIAVSVSVWLGVWSCDLPNSTFLNTTNRSKHLNWQRNKTETLLFSFKVRDEYRSDYDPGRGGYGKKAQQTTQPVITGPAVTYSKRWW